MHDEVNTTSPLSVLANMQAQSSTLHNSHLGGIKSGTGTNEVYFIGITGILQEFDASKQIEVTAKKIAGYSMFVTIAFNLQYVHSSHRRYFVFLGKAPAQQIPPCMRRDFTTS